MATINVTAVVTDTAGQSATVTLSASNDAVTIVNSSLTPQIAPPGTTRTLALLTQSTADLTMTAAVTTDQGASVVVTSVANPVPPQPLTAGQQYFEFTFPW